MMPRPALLVLTLLCSNCLHVPAQTIAAQPAAPAIFGYRDFTAQQKLDKTFLAVADAALAGQHLKILTAEPHWASSPEDYKTAQYVAEEVLKLPVCRPRSFLSRSAQ